MGRLFITGDTHGDFFRIYDFCKKHNTTKNDIMIICGDSGINYYCDDFDIELKERILKIPITFLILHGNHEERAWNIETYQCGYMRVGDNEMLVWYESQYPNILFLGDSELKLINGKKFMFLGGAYSIDKSYRLMMGHKWFRSEQMSEFEMQSVIRSLQSNEKFRKVDYVVSHTCPLKYEPTEYFIQGVDQNTVDKRTEMFLNHVENLIEYDTWFCGHFHCNKKIDKVRFLFKDILELR